MIEVGNKAEVGQVVETDSEDHLTEVDLSMAKFQRWKLQMRSAFRGIKQEISGKTAELIGIEVGQGIDIYQEILEEITEVTIGQDQDQGQLQTETDVSDVENFTILPRIFQLSRYRENLT